MTALFPGALEGRSGATTQAPARPGRIWLGLVLLMPGGLIFGLGLAIAWAGLGLCWPWLRRMTAARTSTREVGGLRVASEQSDSGAAIGTLVPGLPSQPRGASAEPSPPIGWITRQGEEVKWNLC